jgi:hypothetical protein
MNQQCSWMLPDGNRWTCNCDGQTFHCAVRNLGPAH